MKIVRVILSVEAQEAYKLLSLRASNSKIDSSILRSINSKKDAIKSNPHYGEPIAKNLIPKNYYEDYNITNLFWVRLSNHWRMLYTLTNGSEIEIIAFILCIKSHPDYDKLFGYKKDRVKK
jgi:hypothetical protein